MVQPPTDVRAAAERLQVWAYPCVMAQRLRLNFTQPRDPSVARPPTSAGAALGHVGHQRALSDPGLRVGVAPNVDTLYSVAWLDLDLGDHELRTPSYGGRYYSYQVALADTGSPWSLGQRTHGSQLPPLILRRGPLGLQERGGRLEISTPHRFLMICGRTLVEPGDADDVRRVHALQDEVRVRVLAGARATRSDPEGLRDVDLDTCSRADEVREPDGFAHSLARILRDLDPDAVPAQVREDLGTCGMAGDAPRVPTDLAPAVREGLADGVRRIEGRVGALGRLQNGWALSERGPDVGDDLLLRAAVAMAQIYVNPVEEATYPVAEVDGRGEPLDGAQHSYTVSFAADDPPPAQAFWSLTVYHRAGLLVENPLGRHAVGDRTPGLRRESDGSLRVEVSADPPPGGVANWLPAPRGPFRLMLRLYHPTDVAWSPPPVVRAGSGPAR